MQDVKSSSFILFSRYIHREKRRVIGTIASSIRATQRDEFHKLPRAFASLMSGRSFQPRAKHRTANPAAEKSQQRTLNPSYIIVHRKLTMKFSFRKLAHAGPACPSNVAKAQQGTEVVAAPLFFNAPPNSSSSPASPPGPSDVATWRLILPCVHEVEMH